MCDYSVYDNHDRSVDFSMTNPKSSQGERVRFNISLHKKKLSFVMNKEGSLEDLYTKIYNTVYPEFSTERIYDNIPPPSGIVRVPLIYAVVLVNDKDECIQVPIHKFITVDSYMKANPGSFKNIAFMGFLPTYRIFVADEDYISVLRSRAENPKPASVHRYFRCV